MEKRKRPPLPLNASPQEKYDNLILTFFEEWQDDIGEEFQLGNKSYLAGEEGKGEIGQIDFSYLGFSNYAEFTLYMSNLIKRGHIDGRGSSSVRHKGIVYNIPHAIRLNFDGLNYCLSLLESGKNSTRCFVAMAFGIAEMNTIYEEGIKKAIEDNAFRPIRVDKEHTENEQTINDFIIASIKQSRFCVADLTYQRNGVYFEAGYALGRGLKVIYTCLREDHKNVHFDLKTMQTILYDTPEELREALSLKIQAVIIE